jgi:hypothetical protein
MDVSTQNVIGYIGLITGALSAVYVAINHKRIRSTCCGRKMEVSLDFESTTPPGALRHIVSPKTHTFTRDDKHISEADI